MKRHPVVTECHVISFGVPLCARMRNRKLRNIRPSGAFSPEGCSLGRPRQISSMATELALSLVICPFYFHIIYFNNSFRISCVVLQVVYHVRIAFILYFQRF